MSGCPICAGAMREVATRTILGRHTGHYDHCATCGFLRVREPHWLDEAYSSAIAATDTGAVRRNLIIADRLEVLCPLLDGGKGPYLDYGGGVGLLVRLMRDRGFDFRWADAHADNALARGFELGPDDAPAAAVTAIEVLEHTLDPLAFMREALTAGRSRTIVFTTELYAGEPPSEWWYYGVEAGQHIAFFRRETLEALGRQLGLSLSSDGDFHMLSERPLAPAAFAATAGRIARLRARLARRRRGTLVESDNRAMVERARSAHVG